MSWNGSSVYQENESGGTNFSAVGYQMVPGSASTVMIACLILTVESITLAASSTKFFDRLSSASLLEHGPSVANYTFVLDVSTRVHLEVSV